MKGDDTVILASKFRVKNSRVNPRTDKYQGFVAWTKDVCGNDFLKKMRSGEVGVSIVDTNDIYDLNFVYFKNDGRYSMGGFSFELTEVTTMDLPWSWKRGKLFQFFPILEPEFQEWRQRTWAPMMSKSS